jgi:peptidoglycan/xylan/chitin deacetylase (PgdA/CDA1 family)
METRRPRSCGPVTFALLYHDVVEPERQDSAGFPGPLAARYKLAPALFEAHLDAIAATGVRIELMRSGSRPPDAALSFDDAGASALTAATSLERRGWRGHFFVPTSLIGTPGFLDRDSLRTLAQRGHVVGSHSHTHPTYMGKLPREALEREWLESRAILAEVLDEEPMIASVPGGLLSRAVVETAAEAGFRVLMTSEPVARVKKVGDLVLVGRFGIWSTTPAARAAAYVTGARAARAQLWLEWNAKGVAKRLSPQAYQAMRRLRARP